MSGLASDPFGEKPMRWWRSLLQSGKKSQAPKRYSAGAGVLGPLAGLVIQSGDGLDKPTRVAIVAGLTFVPPLVVEYWWRGRPRREEEGLLTTPATGKGSRTARQFSGGIVEAIGEIVVPAAPVGGAMASSDVTS